MWFNPHSTMWRPSWGATTLGVSTPKRTTGPRTSDGPRSEAGNVMGISMGSSEGAGAPTGDGALVSAQQPSAEAPKVEQMGG